MADSSPSESLDIRTLAQAYKSGKKTPKDILTAISLRADAYRDKAVWIHRASAKELQKRARELETRASRDENLPLYGIPFAVKDMIDVAGMPTTAGCPAFSYTPTKSASVVERLTNAGAICVGKTNQDQFATGLAGDRSPYGACRNVFDPEFISGGSSSGSAVAVAAGLVSFALGTDTAGSGRVPAGCCNIVGLKPAPGLVPTDGVVPACRSLDCVSFFALSVDDASQAFHVALGGEAAYSPPASVDFHALNFAVPRDEDLDFLGDLERADLFYQAVTRLEKMGAKRITVDFRPFRSVAELLYEGPWVAERLAAHGEFIRDHRMDVLPITRDIIETGWHYSAVDLFKAMARVEDLRLECLKVLGQAEALVVPTVATLPRLAQVETDSLVWSRRLGTYTNFANLLRLAGLAVPAGFTGLGLPFGITLLAPAGREDRLNALGATWQRTFKLPLGATGHTLPPFEAPVAKPVAPPQPAVEEVVRVAVSGAHLRGQPLHPVLIRLGARFVREHRTSSAYRLMALMDLDPPRPGLVQDSKGTGPIAVELYDLPVAAFGRLVASVSPPLAIGTVHLEDGESVKGFLCEPRAIKDARDVTSFGGWVAFLEHEARPKPIRKTVPIKVKKKAAKPKPKKGKRK